MGLSKRDINNLVNKMYFSDKILIPEISKKLGISQELVAKKLDRTLFTKKEVCDFDKKSVKIILDEVSNYFKIDKELILMKSRIREGLIPRQVAHKLSYELTKASNSYIGSEIGGVDHATVNNSRNAVNDFMDYKNDVADSYNDLYEICKKRLEDEKANGSGVS